MEGAKVSRLQACICLKNLHFQVREKQKLIVSLSLFECYRTLIFKGAGLQALTVKKLGAGLQISDHNQVVGLEPRTNLLKTLGNSLKALPEIFGDDGRPGNLVGKLRATISLSCSNCY